MAEQAPGHQTIRIKIGDAEFESSGPEDAVQEQYRLFLQALSNAPPSRAATDHPAGGGGQGQDRHDDNTSEIDDALIRRTFADRNDVISLRALPRTESADADALVMLLWAFGQLRNEHDIGATPLMRSARQSGLQIERIDRSIAPNNEYVGRAGARRGTRYSLNNRGIAHAERLIREIHQ